MERKSNKRETVLSTQKPFMISPKSDIDFNDVFGGPPRRSSMQEATYSLTQTRSTFTRDDQKPSGRSSWSGLTEKPVFGEEVTNRRRYPSHDFFDDIFRGNESATPSPRKHDIPTLGSLGLSTLPPKGDFFGSSPSGKFSLPAKVTKGKDIPVFGSSTRKHKDGGNSYSHNSSLSRFSSEGQDDARNDLQSSSLESPLLQQLSSSSEELIKPDETDSKKNSTSDTVSGGQFHFSIYKWASKGGVSFAMPFRGGASSRHKEIKFERSSSSNGRIERELLDRRISHDSSKINTPASTDSSRMTFADLLNDPVDYASTRDEQSEIVEETIIPTSDTKPEIHLKSSNERVLSTALEDTGVEIKPHSLHETQFSGKTMKQTSETPKDDQKESKPQLSSLFVSDNDQQGIKKPDEERTTLDSGNAKGKERTTKSSKKPSSRETGKSIKKPDGERTGLHSGEEEKTNLQGSEVTSGDHSKNDAKGKVKDFIKIFNQEPPSIRKFVIDSQSHSSSWKERGTSRVDASSDEKLASKGQTTPDICSPIMEDKFDKQPEEQQHFTTKTKYMSTDTFSQPKNTSESSTPSIPVDSETIVVDIEDSFQENFEVKELAQDEHKSPQTVDDVEDMEIIDTKIRQWAYGKEGNIRSLISTLQYVLWQGSGWKPVPLMDIIEGNAVKRAYQKALLCLHPDKLQQKGIAPHQKHIAEKVFDILQDSWTHFNTLASL